MNELKLKYLALRKVFLYYTINIYKLRNIENIIDLWFFKEDKLSCTMIIIICICNK